MAVCIGAQESFEIVLGEGEEYIESEKPELEFSDDMSTVASKEQSHLEHLQKAPENHSIDDEDADGDSLADDNDLTWRSDPTLSMSDWTVHVTIKGTTLTQTYHVHKSILGVGPKRSNYFATTFLKQQVGQPSVEELEAKHSEPEHFGGIDPCDFLQESMSIAQNKLIETTEYSQCTSKLELEQLSAEAFPVLLDYMYSPTNQLDITTENATALYALAARLEMKTLRRAAKEFWSKDLSMDTLATYYVHSRLFKDEKISSFAEDYCARNIFQIPESRVVEILSSIDPQFFFRIIANCAEAYRTKTADNMDDEGPLRLSLLVAVYGNIHKNTLSTTMFARLTHEMHLPVLELKAAKVLLGLEDDICGTACIMTPLKTRAIKIIAKTWQESCFEAPLDENGEPDLEADSLTLSLPRVEGSALTEFVGAVLKEAKLTAMSLSGEVASLRKWKEDHELTANTKEIIRKVHEDTNKKIEDVTNAKNVELRNLAAANNKEVQSVVNSKNVEIAKLKQQLQQQIADSEAEKAAMSRAHEEALLALQKDMTAKLLEQKEQLEKDSAIKLSAESKKRSAELAIVRRDLGMAKDKLKLQQIAEEGVSSVLKSSRDQTSETAEEKKSGDV